MKSENVDKRRELELSSDNRVVGRVMKESSTWQIEMIHIQTGEYWLLGDLREVVRVMMDAREDN